MAVEKAVLDIVDYAILFLSLIISSGIGVYYHFSRSPQNTFKEYVLANQSMSVVPVAFSLMASFMSAITLLGVSKEIYVYGTQFIVINFSFILATPLVCYLYLPVFFSLGKASVYEYLEHRFGMATRLCASLMFSLQMILYMGIVLYAPALTLSAVTGITQKWSIISVGVVCTFYSSIGGIKAVLMTDVIQSVLMFAAVFSVSVYGVLTVGFSRILDLAKQGNRVEFFNLSLDPQERHTVWSLTVGGIFTYLSLYGINQAQVQRLLTVSSLKKGQAALWIQWPILSLMSLTTCFCGLVLYSYYHDCDPVQANKITSTDQILPLYVLETMGEIPGLSGLFIAGIFSGSLSSISSALNSLSAVTVKDYVMGCSSASEVFTTRLTMGLTVMYGLLCIFLAFMADAIGTGVLQASLTVFGAVGGPLLGLFTMGMAFHFINQKGAIIGLFGGLTLTLWIGFHQSDSQPPVKPTSISGCPALNESLTLDLQPENEISRLTLEIGDAVKVNASYAASHPEQRSFLENIYAVSYMWISCIGFVTTFVLGLCISYVSGGCGGTHTQKDALELYFHYRRKEHEVMKV